jgi:transcriptional regulator with XRE-family HTH domain
VTDYIANIRKQVNQSQLKSTKVLKYFLYMSFGQRIKQLRREAGLTQEVLGLKIKVKKQSINKYEAGKAKPETLEMVKLMSVALNADFEELKALWLTEVDKPKSLDISKEDLAKETTIPTKTFLDLTDDLRALNKEMQERLKNEIAYEKEIRELKIKLLNLENEIDKLRSA